MWSCFLNLKDWEPALGIGPSGYHVAVLGSIAAGCRGGGASPSCRTARTVTSGSRLLRTAAHEGRCRPRAPRTPPAARRPAPERPGGTRSRRHPHHPRGRSRQLDAPRGIRLPAAVVVQLHRQGSTVNQIPPVAGSLTGRAPRPRAVAARFWSSSCRPSSPAGEAAGGRGRTSWCPVERRPSRRPRTPTVPRRRRQSPTQSHRSRSLQGRSRRSDSAPGAARLLWQTRRPPPARARSGRGPTPLPPESEGERAPSGRRALVGLESAPMDALGRAGRGERWTIQPRKKTHECYSKGNRRPAK